MGSTVAKVTNPALCCFKGWCMDNKLLEDDKRLNLFKKTNTTVGFAISTHKSNIFFYKVGRCLQLLSKQVM